MPIPAGVAIAGAGLGFVGDLLGSRGGLPQEFIDELTGLARTNRTDAFLPDKAAYDADLQAKIDELMASIPGSEEQFNANAASRGVFTSGESLKHLYSDVYAPIARAGTSAIASSNLGYAQAYQSGSIAASQQQQNYYQMLIGAMLNKEPAFLDKLGQGMGDLGSLGVQAYLYEQLAA